MKAELKGRTSDVEKGELDQLVTRLPSSSWWVWEEKGARWRGGKGDKNKRVGEEEMKKRSDVIREGESLGEGRDKLRRKVCHKDM